MNRARHGQLGRRRHADSAYHQVRRNPAGPMRSRPAINRYVERHDVRGTLQQPLSRDPARMRRAPLSAVEDLSGSQVLKAVDALLPPLPGVAFVGRSIVDTINTSARSCLSAPIRPSMSANSGPPLARSCQTDLAIQIHGEYPPALPPLDKEGKRWTYITPPAAGSSRGNRARPSHRRSQIVSAVIEVQ